MKIFTLVATITWTGLWFTADQQGYRLFEKGKNMEAARVFEDPMWQGVSLFRAGEFKDAAQIFALIDSAEGHYNQGNAWLMHGAYDAAIKSYERALEKRPDWTEASENRDLAIARAKMTEVTGGDMGDQTIGADKIVFDKNAKNEGQETQVSGDQASTAKDIQAMWLRRVQTKPADFLKAKFEFQNGMKEEGAE
ncbi:MAG: tetratricopeptide repeat protein [Akkermansiaceae bacterium]|jgi:Ca-activated chloride channel family protein|nr:tetratricopeptide repeat protein [Akkermansiaceae bacterium]